MTRICIFSILLTTAAVLTGCGGGSTLNVQNQAAPPGSNLAIAFQPAPPGSIFMNQTAPVTAVVANDPSGLGVDWVVSCPSAPCGTVNPPHTDSGKPTIYTPPVGSNQNSEVAVVRAYATADHSKNVTAAITVNGFAAKLKGTFVLQTSGYDPNVGSAYQFEAVVTLDGNGSVSGGKQIYSNISGTFVDTVTSGRYFLGLDGRGTLILNTADTNIGQAGEEMFSMVYLSSSQALIAKLDDANNPAPFSLETSQGTMDLQTSTAPLTGGYALVLNGVDAGTSFPVAWGGIINVDSQNHVTGEADQALLAENLVTTDRAITGTISTPDKFGAVQVSLTANFSPTPILLTGFIVDSTHIKLIEVDYSASGTGAWASGVAISQGSATGTFTNASFSGDYVFSLNGEDSTFALPSSLTAAGVLTADGQGNIPSGYNDEFANGNVFSNNLHTIPNQPFQVDAAGRVVATMRSNGASDDPKLYFYLTGNGNPALILDADFNVNNIYGFAVGAGLAYPAAAQVSFNGKYATVYTQFTGSELDASGQFTASSSSQQFSGVVDTNFSAPYFGLPISGTFVSANLPNRLTGTVTNTLLQQNGVISVAYYLIDSNHGFFVQNDGINSGAGALGYFASRNPICSTCQ